jgi:hypothetical protein
VAPILPRREEPERRVSRPAKEVKDIKYAFRLGLINGSFREQGEVCSSLSAATAAIVRSRPASRYVFRVTEPKKLGLKEPRPA